jgi:hypothetical protein
MGSDRRLRKAGRHYELVGMEESSEKKSVLSGSRQWVDSPEAVSGSTGGPGPWKDSAEAVQWNTSWGAFATEDCEV